MDWLLIVAVFLLVCFGLISLFSLALNSTETNLDFFNKQLFFSLLGILFVFIFALFDYRWLKATSIWLYILSLIFLILVLFFGANLKGTTGWFILGNFSFQPIELAKISIIFLLAYFFSSNFNSKYSLSLWIKSFSLVLPICFLAFLQPDFGSMSIVLIVWFGMLWLSGITKKKLFIFIITLLIFSVLFWNFGLHDYQKNRLLSFINPQIDPLGTNYNARQSIIAIGSGGFWGRGLGLGTQSQLNFLPVSEADFIFSALAEELGFLSSFFIIFIYLFIFYRLFKILKKTRDSFGVFCVFGLTLMFFSQVLINIGMTIGMMPVTGLPLPFISYGGSFLLISLISIGVIQSIKIRN